MARGYKATLEVKCWKEHTCCYCGAAYRYLLDRRQAGSGATQTDAVSAARTGAVRALRNAVELFPCPACGHYQPDMIGAHRFRRHLVLLLAGTALWLVLYLLAVVGLLSAAAALWLLIFGAVPTWIAATWFAASNPNRSMRANKARGERLVQAKQLELLSAANERDDRPRSVVIESGLGVVSVSALLALTILLMPGAELVRLAGDWHSNPGWQPPIFGPGDTAWTWIEPAQPLETRGGEWRFISGSASIPLNQNNPVNNNDKAEKVPVTVTSRAEPLRPVAADEPLRTPRLWVRLHFPKNHKLSKKRVRIDMTLNLAVPAVDGPERETRQEVTATVEARLARPFAAFLYAFFWHTALFGGGALFLLAGVYHLLSDAALRRTAPPTRVTALAGDEGPEPAVAEPKQTA